MSKNLILVTGATGYIGGLLIPKLLERGYRVRELARDPKRLSSRTWYRQIEIIAGDALNLSALARALEGVHTAYYLIHNMSNGYGYTGLEIQAAKNFARAAEQVEVQHIIYLGGLADPKEKIPAHLRSRIETGKKLRSGNVPVTEFRAGVIVGPGSISFEMIRFMTELLPVIIGPNWLRNISQPIAVQNVIDYLLAAQDNHAGQGLVFEIGGPDRMPYAELMLTYGSLRGLQRKLLTLPVIPLWFMALGVDWMTPVPASIARPLVDGLRSNSLVQDESARRIFPDVKLIGYKDAVKVALEFLQPDLLEPVWTSCDRPVKVMKHEGFFIDYRCEEVDALPEKVFRKVASLGGKNGWPYANWLWKLRGWVDKILGGPGLRLSDRPLQEGDTLDYYRIEKLVPNRLLRLHSELKAPGDGWMEWRVESDGEKTKLSQTGFFAPHGMPGFLYWYALGPLHKLVFRGLIKAISRQSEME